MENIITLKVSDVQNFSGMDRTPILVYLQLLISKTGTTGGMRRADLVRQTKCCYRAVGVALTELEAEGKVRKIQHPVWGNLFQAV
jgi:hypothetical protein